MKTTRSDRVFRANFRSLAMTGACALRFFVSLVSFVVPSAICLPAFDEKIRGRRYVDFVIGLVDRGEWFPMSFPCRTSHNRSNRYNSCNKESYQPGRAIASRVELGK